MNYNQFLKRVNHNSDEWHYLGAKNEKNSSPELLHFSPLAGKLVNSIRTGNLLTTILSICRMSSPSKNANQLRGEYAMLKEFKEFAMRGNVLDLAVAVIIGGAFGKIITSLVADVLMPVIGLVLGGLNFSELSFTVGEAVVKWGAFVQSIIDFVIVAFVIFMIVRAMNRMQKPAPVAAPTTKECPYCFSTIPLKATRCPNCTSQL